MKWKNTHTVAVICTLFSFLSHAEASTARCKIGIVYQGDRIDQIHSMATLNQYIQEQDWSVEVLNPNPKVTRMPDPKEISDLDAILYVKTSHSQPIYHEYYIQGATYTITGYVDYRKISKTITRLSDDYTEASATAYFQNIVDVENTSPYFRDPALKALKRFAFRIGHLLPACKN
jgi:hypothetical protein